MLILFNISCNSQQKKINGISFVASREAITTKHIQSVKKAQSNYIALMPFGFIREIASPKIYYNTQRQWFGETKKGLLQYANTFKKEGFKIMVKPQIWVWQGTYTGFIAMNSEAEWKALEDAYTTFILEYAQTAENLNAAVFCIGTELEQFVLKRPKYWQELILKIRKVYKGKLTYAANWDEFKRVPFWAALDFIGIDAYFPLSDKKTPTVKELSTGWQIHKKEIIKVAKANKKQVLFTEFGYRSVDFNAKEPWNFNNSGTVNLEAQVNGLQAIYNQFWKEDWFAGGFLWKWFHNHEHSGGINNTMFTPQNKPAEAIVKKMYQSK